MCLNSDGVRVGSKMNPVLVPIKEIKGIRKVKTNLQYYIPW